MEATVLIFQVHVSKSLLDLLVEVGLEVRVTNQFRESIPCARAGWEMREVFVKSCRVDR